MGGSDNRNLVPHEMPEVSRAPTKAEKKIAAKESELVKLLGTKRYRAFCTATASIFSLKKEKPSALFHFTMDRLISSPELVANKHLLITWSSLTGSNPDLPKVLCMQLHAHGKMFDPVMTMTLVLREITMKTLEPSEKEWWHKPARLAAWKKFTKRTLPKVDACRFIRLFHDLCSTLVEKPRAKNKARGLVLNYDSESNAFAPRGFSSFDFDAVLAPEAVSAAARSLGRSLPISREDYAVHGVLPERRELWLETHPSDLLLGHEIKMPELPSGPDPAPFMDWFDPKNAVDEEGEYESEEDEDGVEELRRNAAFGKKLCQFLMSLGWTPPK